MPTLEREPERTPSALHATLLSVTWPIFVEQGLRTLIGTVDTLMVSRLGDDAVAGVSVASQIVTLAGLTFWFLAIGSSVVITHHLGARDRAGADRVAATAIAANFWVGVVLSVALLLLVDPALRLMHVPAGPLPYARPFLVLMGGSLFVEALAVALGAALRAHTHTRDVMLVTLGQNVLNVAGNTLLLFGFFGLPRLGVVGVAISSVVSRVVACAATWVLLAWRTGLHLRARDFVAIRAERVRRVLRIGLPAAGENISYWLAYMTVTTFVATMGATELATQNYTLNVNRWVILLCVSVGLGTEVLIGHLVGAGEFDAAYRRLVSSVRLSFGGAIAAMLVIGAVAPSLIGLFTATPAIVAGGAVLLRMGLLLEPGRVFNVVVISSLRATGDVRFPITVGVIVMWGVWVPLAWLLGVKLGYGLPGVWVSMICDEWIRGLLMFRRWRRRQWLPAAVRSHAAARVNQSA